MYVASRILGIALLMSAVWFGTLKAQEAPVDARSTVEMTGEESDRAQLRDLFARPEVQRAARIGGIDLGEAEARLGSLEGDQLHRAAEQARAIESTLDAEGGAQRISLQVTTIIVILLLVIIIILIA
jgi:hypothetical protein